MLISLNGLKSVSESTMWLLHRCALDWMQQSAALTYAHYSHYATDVTCFQGVCSWTVDCRNVHQSCSLLTTCSFYYHFQCHFRECGSASNWSHFYRPQGTPSAQDLHIQLRHLRPATRTADAISVQTVKQRPREAHLHASCPHQSLESVVVIIVTNLSGQHFIYLKLHISDWLFYCDQTCTLVMQFNQTVEMPHLSGGWIVFRLWQTVLKIWNIRHYFFVQCLFKDIITFPFGHKKS